MRDAVIDATAALVASHGLRGVTMLQIAEATGIGRATLYRYFSDVEAILRAWHDRQISRHLAQLTGVRDRSADARGRLRAVLEAFAFISHEGHRQHDADLAAMLHRDERVARAHRQVHRLFRDLLVDAAAAGEVRDDIDPDEQARYCLHALSAAGGLSSRAAVRRLVTLTLAGLRTERPSPRPGPSLRHRRTRTARIGS